MGKSKKNRTNNFVNIDDEFTNVENVENVENIQDDNIVETPRKKNVFAQLDEFYDIDDSDDIGNNLNNNNEIISKVISETKPDTYFSQGYHADDYENDYEAALDLYKLSLENDSKQYVGVAANNIGVIYQTKFDELGKAEIYYKIACANNYLDAFAHLGLLYFKQDKFSEAVKYFAESVKYGNINDFYQYAECLEKNGDKELAFKFLQYHLMLKNASQKEKKMFSRLITSEYK